MKVGFNVEYPPFTASKEDEQKYFDHAYRVREDKRQSLRSSYESAGDAKTRAALKHNAEKYEEKIGGPEREVAFKRFDTIDGKSLYVGYSAVVDEKSDALVYSWKSPALRSLSQATPQNPGEVQRVREFLIPGEPINAIKSFEDKVFAELAQQIATLENPELAAAQGDEFLQKILNDNGSDTQMRDIARTIQASQMELIASPADRLLIVQGGPGTGKTAVALHRISYLLEQHHPEHNTEYSLLPEDIAVIGPNVTFKRYIKDVLPVLGDTDVHQFSTDEFIYPAIKTSQHDSKDVAALKGSRRMIPLLRKAVQNRVRIPREGISLRIQSAAPLTFDLNEKGVEGLVNACRSNSYRSNREQFKNLLQQEVEKRLTAEAARNGLRRPANVMNLISTSELNTVVARIWPNFSAQEMLNDLLGSTERLIDADGTLSGDDVRLLQRPRKDRLTKVEWTSEDLPLLDYIDALVSGRSEVTMYEHIVIDEAQDLTAMQIEAIKRRSISGYMTLVGDIAQVTSAVERNSWEDVTAQFNQQQDIHEAKLEHGYRVPKEAMEVAASLLPHIAPDITAPHVVRTAQRPPQFHAIDPDEHELAQYVCNRAQEYASKGRFLGVIVSARTQALILKELEKRDITFTRADQGKLSERINVLTPEVAKGLEFQSLIVVDPEGMVQQSEHGLRSLYIALTRTTGDLELVFHEGTLPQELIEVAAKYGYSGQQLTDFTSRSANNIENEIRGALHDELKLAEQNADELTTSGAHNLAETVPSSEQVLTSLEATKPKTQVFDPSGVRNSNEMSLDVLSQLKPATAQQIKEQVAELIDTATTKISEEVGAKYHAIALEYLAQQLQEIARPSTSSPAQGQPE